jgi:glycosyltransferase involved in cell wall biosynthesis
MALRRIAFILSDGLSSPGGIGRIMTYVSRSIARRHPDIVIIDQAARFSLRPFIKHLTMPLAVLQFAARCVMGQVDMAHINVARRGSTWRKMIFAKVADFMGKPVLLHLHGSGYDGYFSTLTHHEKIQVTRFFNRAAAVVALSPFWRSVLVDQIGVDPARVHVIANGVPEYGLPESIQHSRAPNILFLGEVGPRKGVDILLGALALLNKTHPEWSAVVAGNGAVDDARQQCAALNLSSRVQFTGWVNEAAVDALLGAADIFVLPSRAENQPVSILEAMARGLPVVSTRVGAIPEQVIDGETGLLVDAANVDGLATALSALLDDQDLRHRMGKAGHAHFAAHYSVDACADQFVALYKSIVPK